MTITNNNNKNYRVSCGCGSVGLFLQETQDAARFVSQPSVYCHCSDCVGFPTQCYQAGCAAGVEPVDVVNHTLKAVNHVFFYNQNVSIETGHHKIQWHKRAETTSTHRFYATCCGTPLGFWFQPMNVTAVYGPLLKGVNHTSSSGENAIAAPPKPIYAFHATTPELMAKHSDDDDQDKPPICVYGESIPFYPVLAHFLARKALGSVLGKNVPASLVAPQEENLYSVGAETTDIKLAL